MSTLLDDCHREREAAYRQVIDLVEDLEHHQKKIGTTEWQKLMRAAVQELRNANVAYAYALAGAQPSSPIFDTSDVDTVDKPGPYVITDKERT